jgi:hypothetical protein
MASKNFSSTLSFNTMVHMVTIKLSSTNFLLWRSQVVPLLQCQKLYGYVDGSTPILTTPHRQSCETSKSGTLTCLKEDIQRMKKVPTENQKST